ncbi:hypothetical protein ABPG75_001143 [Micractinium tetrahymenae]
MEAPRRGPAKGRRLRLVIYAAGLALALWLLCPPAGKSAAGGGAATLARRGSTRTLSIPHKKTATCHVASFQKQEGLRRCSDPYAHPFSGCLTDAYEAGVFGRLLAGKKVSHLRCGFLDDRSRRWLDELHERFAGCRYPVFTASFSYGQLPSTEGVAAQQPGACFVAFVDAAAVQQLQGAAGFNGSHYGRWELVDVDPKMISEGTARSAHLMKILAPRLFPAAAAALYIDIKVALLPDPLALIRLVERSEAPVLLGVVAHPPEAERDTFDEIVTTIHHLYQRRLRPDPSRDKTVVERRSAYLTGITSRDFHDVFRQYMLFSRLGYPMHSNGMLNAAVLVWNLQNPCVAAFACLWHNQVAYYSMREQLNFHYVLNMLGLTDQVLALAPIPNSRHPELAGNLTLAPTGWPAWGQATHDDFWGEVPAAR